MEEWQQAPAADTGALFEAIARQQMRIAVENVPWEEEEEENERDRKKKKKERSLSTLLHRLCSVLPLAHCLIYSPQLIAVSSAAAWS